MAPGAGVTAHPVEVFLAAAVTLIASPADGAEFWLPMGFIIAGLLLFLWEVSMPGFFIALPATVLIVLGLIGLFVPGFFTQPALVLLVGVVVAAPVTVIMLRLYRRFAPPDAPPTTTTGESLVGREGTVTVPVDTDSTRGKVRLQGVVWSARAADAPIAVGEKVVVVQTQGVHVVVRPRGAALGPTPGARSPSQGPAGPSNEV